MSKSKYIGCEFIKIIILIIILNLVFLMLVPLHSNAKAENKSGQTHNHRLTFEPSPKIKIAKIDELNIINIETNSSFKVLNDGKEGIKIKSNKKVVAIKKVKVINKNSKETSLKAKIILKDNLNLKNDYTIYKEGFKEANAIPGNILNNEKFVKMYTYDQNDLGAYCQNNKTTFKLWAPLSKKISVLLYKNGNGGEPIKELPMQECNNGIWVTTLNENLNGIYYTYKVTNNDKTLESVDPYAKAVGVNGLRGMIVNLADTNPEGWSKDVRPPLKNQTDAIIYELHIRDLSTDKDSGIKNKGKYLGLAETGTKSPDGEATGIDHIKDLGVTHVHLLPIYDFATIDETKLNENKFNWGYDPQNYNVPEGSYATDPYNGAVRIKEFKQMVKTLHDSGISVIMDVVYNHTYFTKDSNLNKIVPDYYYRQNPNSTFSNASGCGNEIASERPMVRKMIVDSIKYWAEEYHVDGFRFDLMGAMDIETMNTIRREVDIINPNTILYGEGWTGGSSPLDENLRAVKRNTGKLDNIAAFSDDMRDGIKGHVFSPKQPGFINGASGMERTIMFGVTASTMHNQMVGYYNEVNYSNSPWANNPTQTVTYNEAHDNLTLWDKLMLTNPDSSIQERINMHKLAGGITLTSQGISFLHAGSEFLRTKQGVSNSYNSPDSINQLDWSRKREYKDVYNYYKGLIELRKKHPAFRMATTEEVNRNLVFIEGLGEKVVGYTINNHANNDNWKTIAVVYNASNNEKEVCIPGGTKKWGIVVDKNIAGTKIIDVVNNNVIKVQPKSLIVLTDTIDSK